ncbi:hypothetical protein BH09BAC4_BH09BAC4_22950 [soil metagenome]
MNSLPNNFLMPTSPQADAVELVEYGDFACSQCQRVRQLIDSILKAFAGRLTYTFCHFPNHRSDSSILASMAAEAARRQGFFWPMFRALFTQPTINHANLLILATYLGMNSNQFNADLADEQVRLHIDADQQEGYRLGVTKTPTLFVGGQQFHGKLTQSRLSSIIHTHLSRSPQPILTKVDLASGTIYWGQGEWN